MKKTLFILTIASLSFVSCNSIYKSQQTPDDLYYSEGRNAGAAEVRRNQRYEEDYQQYVSTMDDNFLRMRVANNARWSTIDNFAYWNDMRYGFTPIGFNNFNNGWGINNGWGFGNQWGVRYNPWNIGWNQGWGMGFGINAWNTWCPNPWGPGVWGSPGFNNPFFSVIGYVNPKMIVPTTNSGSNLSAFRNPSYNNRNYPVGGKDSWYTPGTQGNGNNFNNLVRRVFSNPSPSSNGYANSYDRPARTFSSGSSYGGGLSSSAGGSSGGFNSAGSSAGGGRGGRN